MGRIPDEDIQRLKRDISLEQLRALARHRPPPHRCQPPRPLPLPRRPRALAGDHARQQPVALPGACQAGGSVIDFVMKAEGVSFRHAVELLRRGADLAESGQPKPVVKGLHRRKLEPLAGQEASDAELLGQVADHYHASLLESDDAQRYRRGRGLEHADLAATFRLGFANRTLGTGCRRVSSRRGSSCRSPAGAARRLARHGARAPARFAGGAALGHRGRGGAALRAEDRRPHRA